MYKVVELFAAFVDFFNSIADRSNIIDSMTSQRKRYSFAPYRYAVQECDARMLYYCSTARFINASICKGEAKTKGACKLSLLVGDQQPRKEKHFKMYIIYSSTKHFLKYAVGVS